MIGIRVTVEDLKTGDTERMTIADDYILVTAGRCYLAHTQAYANGTHQLTVKGRTASKPADARQAERTRAENDARLADASSPKPERRMA